VYLRGKIYQKKERKKEKKEDKFIQKIYHKKKKDNITLLNALNEYSSFQIK
jgi:hypothetical protein